LLLLGLFATISLFRNWSYDRPRINGPLGWLLLGFAAWALLSLSWAEDIALTSKRLIVFVILSIAALAVARRHSLREIILWTFFSTTLFLVIGFLSEALLGTFHPFGSGYRFAGTMHPNGQGINCGLLLLSGVAAADTEKCRPWLFRCCALVGFGFLLLTGSRTAFAAVMLALAPYFVLVSSRLSKAVVTLGLSIALWIPLVVGGGALFSDLQSATMLGRKDSGGDSFNGRNDIWQECAYYVARRPITGYGFGGFWDQYHISEISASSKWGVSSGHSAYLDCVLELGLVGLIAYVLALFLGIERAFRFYKISHSPAFAFSGAVLLFCLLDGLLESVSITPTLLMFLCMVTLAQLAYACSAERRLGSSFQGDTSMLPSRFVKGEGVG
jgi:exopolysaccharide production protein ExoQ